MTRPRLSYRPVFLLLGGLLTCLPSGCRSAKAEEEEKPPPAPVQLRGYNNFTLEEWTDLTPGTTQPLPNRVARVSAPVEGRVVSLLHDAQGQPLVEGQSVKKGDVIAQLDASVVRAHRDQLAAAQAELKEQKKQAEYALQLADIDVERNERLTRRDAGGVREKLVSDIQLETAKINRDDARSKLALAERKLETGAKELQGVNEQLKLYTLTAPISGRLGRLLVVEGQTLPPGTVVADVIDLDEEVDVLCFVPPHLAQRLKLGEQPARIAPDEGAKEGPAASPEGKIVFIADQAEADTGNFAVKVRFPNRDLRLRSNTVARVQVLTRQAKEERPCLPESALLEDQEPPMVVIVEDLHTIKDEGKDVEVGTARKLRVQTGIRDRNLHAVEVLRLEDPEKKGQVPLDNSLQFVIKGAQGLQTGDTVKVEKEEDED
jgi:RND family efflux transporter MFP subunit